VNSEPSVSSIDLIQQAEYFLQTTLLPTFHKDMNVSIESRKAKGADSETNQYSKFPGTLSMYEPLSNLIQCPPLVSPYFLSCSISASESSSPIFAASGPDPGDLVAVSGGIVFRTDNQTSPLFGSLVDCFDDVNQLLLVLEYPIQLVVITGPKIAHLCAISLRHILQLQCMHTICLLRKKNMRVTGS